MNSITHLIDGWNRSYLPALSDFLELVWNEPNTPSVNALQHYFDIKKPSKLPIMYWEYCANFISLLSHVDEETLQAVFKAMNEGDFE